MCSIALFELDPQKQEGFHDGETCDWQAAVRVSAMIRLSPSVEPQGRLLSRMADYARRIEKSGFPGIWVGDSLGRDRPTLDPLVVLAALSTATERVELGIAVLQVSLRHPIELAHRVQSVQALSGGRLRLGVGSGSTRADFELLGGDYERRFRTLMSSLDIMRRAWRGEPVNGGTLSTWPGCEGGPPVLLGVWRNPRWISHAAKEYQGWTPSGRYSSWADLEAGMRVYREAGGTNAVLANVAVDLANRPESASLAEVAHVSLICSPDEARQRLKRIEQLGFDEVLLVSHAGALEDIERARDVLQPVTQDTGRPSARHCSIPPRSTDTLGTPASCN
jgi:alkanesulfonate monooxygenase SsuD/methylene tetrahydromethanopterin reductase-like flavin-dependent oxidoreductase (luciferase family)